MTKKKVVIYTPMYDTGGQGSKLKRGIERYYGDEYEVRSIVTHLGNFEYPTDLKYEPNEAYRLFAEADIIHMRNGVEGLKRLLKARDPQRAFRLVVHHHGTRFRLYHELIAPQARAWGAVQVASTLDLTLLELDVEWLPSPFDTGELLRYRPTDRPNGPIRIAHAPTNREVKSTTRVIEAIKNLAARGHSIEFDLIERQTWSETMRRKGLADIVVDQLELGIGNNALEAFGMAIPVVAGIADTMVRDAMIARWSGLPFYDANNLDLEESLQELIIDPELRSYWGARGFDYLHTWHSEPKVIDQLIRTYEGASLTEGVVRHVEA